MAEENCEKSETDFVVRTNTISDELSHFRQQVRFGYAMEAYEYLNRAVYYANKLEEEFIEEHDITHEEMTTIYECPDCGNKCYLHKNIGAAILWCDEHGVIAVQKQYRGDVDTVKQMTDEQYNEFVEGGDRGE